MGHWLHSVLTKNGQRAGPRNFKLFVNFSVKFVTFSKIHSETALFPL